MQRRLRVEYPAGFRRGLASESELALLGVPGHMWRKYHPFPDRLEDGHIGWLLLEYVQCGKAGPVVSECRDQSSRCR